MLVHALIITLSILLIKYSIIPHALNPDNPFEITYPLCLRIVKLGNKRGYRFLLDNIDMIKHKGSVTGLFGLESMPCYMAIATTEYKDNVLTYLLESDYLNEFEDIRRGALSRLQLLGELIKGSHLSSVLDVQTSSAEAGHRKEMLIKLRNMVFYGRE